MEMRNKNFEGAHTTVIKHKDRIIVSMLENGVLDHSTLYYDEYTWNKLKEMYCLEDNTNELTEYVREVARKKMADLELSNRVKEEA